jgi:hypothetical protein
VLFFATQSNAGLLPTVTTITPDGEKFRWTYAIVLPTDSRLTTGNYFTIYDFAGFVPGSNFEPADWSFSSQLLGITPTGVVPSDDPTLPNLTWTYTGPTIDGQVGLANFWALSDFDQPSEGHFTARTLRSADNIGDSNITDTLVPVPAVPPAVPEPTTLTLLGLGLPLIGLMRYCRREKK